MTDTETNPIGRPPKYETPEEIQPIIDQFFKTCETGKVVNVISKKAVVTITRSIPPTVEGLALALGFSGRQSLERYKKKPEFVDTFACAFTRIVQTVLVGGAIGEYDFRLVQAMAASIEPAYRQKQEIEVSGTMTHIPSLVMLGMINNEVKQIGHDADVVDGEVEE